MIIRLRPYDAGRRSDNGSPAASLHKLREVESSLTVELQILACLHSFKPQTLLVRILLGQDTARLPQITTMQNLQAVGNSFQSWDTPFFSCRWRMSFPQSPFSKVRMYTNRTQLAADLVPPFSC